MTAVPRHILAAALAAAPEPDHGTVVLDAVRGETHDGDGWHLRVDLPLADAARLAAQADGAPLRPLLPTQASELPATLPVELDA